MKISGFHIKNKFINYENLTFDFSNFGIYKISGENGTGKTSIIEKIVFGTYHVQFDSEKFFQLWKNRRYAIFTYIPQDIVDSNQNVGEYICKGNRYIKTTDAIALLNEFGLEESIISQKFKVLSGGEKKKIQIISGLLKDTPYIFIDEPTNNLDNASVNCLNKILNKLKDNKIIILISHDERLKCEVIAEYNLFNNESVYINNKKLSVTQKHSASIDTLNTYNTKPNFFKILIPVLRNYGQIVTIFILLFGYIMLSLYATYEFKNGLSEETPVRENIILVQASTYYDEELLSYYVKGENIIIDESLHTRYLNLGDIYEDVSNLEGVDKIYITDIKYQNNIESMILDATIGNELHYVSFPKEYTQDFWDSSYIDYGLDLLEGEFPEDEGMEVAISKNLLCNYFGYTEETASEAIGDNIVLSLNGNEETYEIVGFTYFDYILISYNENMNYGAYCYNETTFEAFAMEQIQFEIDRDGWPALVRESIILTSSGYEADILNHLMTNYPAGYYLSNHYTVVSSNAYNRGRFIEVLIPNLIVACVLSIAFIFINHYAIKYNYAILWDYGNYYVNRSKMKFIYCLTSLTLYLLIVILLIIGNSFISPYAYMSNWYLLIDGSITLVPLSTSYFIKKGKRKF